MTQARTPGSEFQWKDLVLLLFGVGAEALVAGAFADDFYLAVGIVFAAFIFLVFIAIKSTLARAINVAGAVIAAAVLIVVHTNNATSKPGFEINFLHLPLGSDNAYYVTDSLIRTQGDLSRFHEFQLSPLSVEVVPDYLGNEKYGNVILRMAGSSASKDFQLWADFDQRAQTQTVEISLADILQVSGIQMNAENEATNLMLGATRYQQASLKFDVIRLSQPDRPLGPTRELLVKNAPWKQEVSIVWRDGRFLDYALTNFGGEAKFHCRMNIGRVLSDVSASDDIFWSGVATLDNPPRCEPFTLKTGETYQVSFALNNDTLGEDLGHGRYLVEIYSFPERADVTFAPESGYDKSGNVWLLSTESHVQTFVVCGDPGKTCEQTSTLPVEQKTIRAFSFTSGAEFNNGYTYFVVRTYALGNRTANQYVLDYSIDPQKTGWVGFGVWFENLVDVSMFNAIQFKLELDASLHPLWLDVKGKVGGDYKVSRVAIGKDPYGAATTAEQTVTVPFSAFEGIDWTQVDTLNFVIDSVQVPDTNQHQLRVSEIQFVR